MARTKSNQRSASSVSVPMGATGGRTPPSKATMALLATSVVSAVWAAAMLTPPGRIAYVYLFAYSEFYMGVLSLVSLSITVMFGLVATDRMVLSIRQRVLMQSAHRTTGIIAVAALVVHVMTKFSMGHVTVIDLFVPFLAANQTLYIGFGTLAGMSMVSVLWTGIVRARFAGRGKPWMWRALHSVAYLSWPIALTHGLTVGRAAATWVVVSYIVCVLFVLIALAVRLSVSLGRKKDFASTSTGSIKPVGKLVPTAAASVKARAKKRDRGGEPVVESISARVVADRDNAPAAVLNSWVPAAPVGARPPAGPAAPVSAHPSVGPVAPVTARPAAGPVSGRPYDEVYRPTKARSRPAGGRDEPQPRPRRNRRDDDGYAEVPVSGGPFADGDYEADYEDPAYGDPAYGDPRYGDSSYDGDGYDADPRRYADEDASVRGPRRRAGTERYDEVTRSISRRAMDEGRRRYADDEAPRASRRHEDDAAAARPRRYADQQEPASRRRGYAEQDEPAPRPRRDRSVDRPVEPQRPGARTRGYAEQDESPAPRARRYADDDYREPPRPRASRYADEQQPPARSSRYAEDDDPVPAARSRRVADADRDSGRHSRGDLTPAADPWGGINRGADDVPSDDTPTLIDIASRRARRATAEAPRANSRGNRRRGRLGDDADDMYWRQLRGEAQ